MPSARGVTEPNTIAAVFTQPLQVAAVPADEVIVPGLSPLLITHLLLQLPPIWSRTRLLTDAD